MARASNKASDNEPTREPAPAQQPPPADHDPAQDPAAAQVQERFDREAAQGFRGVEVDPTPNENYTVSGVTGGAPTPETDPEAAEAARKAQATAERHADADPGR